MAEVHRYRPFKGGYTNKRWTMAACSCGWKSPTNAAVTVVAAKAEWDSHKATLPKSTAATTDVTVNVRDLMLVIGEADNNTKWSPEAWAAHKRLLDAIGEKFLESRNK